MRHSARYVCIALALAFAMADASAAEVAQGPKVPSRVPVPVSPTGDIPLPLSVQPAAASAAVETPASSDAVAQTGVHGLISRYASLYELPVSLVNRVVARESRFNPAAYHRGNWGLMQIKAETARRMGYRGPASGLLDPDTNLKYAVKYLRGAYLVARKDEERAVAYYRSGFYYRAKRMGLLEVAGLK